LDPEVIPKITKYPIWVDLKWKDAIPETVDHVIVTIDPEKWDGATPRSLDTDGIHNDHIDVSSMNAEAYSQAAKVMKPQAMMRIIDAFEMDQCLIFARTRIDCDNIEKFLIEAGGSQWKFDGKVESGKENKYNCAVLHSGRSMQERRQNIEAFKEADIRFLICTDIAARGIDIKELPYVINMTLPEESEDYIHRVGRVGRADRIGMAISLVSKKKEKVWYHKCKRSDTCHDTRLLEAGGCAKWIDETNMIEQIEKRLGGMKLAPLDAGHIQRAKSHSYGQLREDPLAKITQMHMPYLQSLAREVAMMQDESQVLYLKTRYGLK